MSSKQVTEIKKGPFKEMMLKEIALQLSQALPTLKETLGEKKFDKRIKKAAKMLGEGIKPVGEKKASRPKKNADKPKETKVKKISPVKKAAKNAPAK